MRVRLDSSLGDDAGWTTPPAEARRVLRGTPVGAKLSGGVAQTWRDPLEALSWLDHERRVGRRWVGYFAYELGRLFEPTAATKPLPNDSTLFVWGEVGPSPTSRRRGGSRGSGFPAPDPRPSPRRPDSTFTRDAYLRAVARCVDYIRAGDIFQVNLSQTFTLPFAGTADALYAALLDRSPAAYGALLDFADHAILCNSPELFLRVTNDRRVVTRPIKGTRPLGERMAYELMVSEKDAAELNMIVDLERNDLGRVCETGSVRVSQPRMVEWHPTLFHGVATVEGRLRENVGLVDLLRATFPGGSITGAPKIRAMQIINELEPVPRGPYCGAIGHLDPDGSLQLNVAIRTATLAGGVLKIPVGGGIVADSDPAAEYEETLVKARAILDAATLEAASQRGPGPAHDPHA